VEINAYFHDHIVQVLGTVGAVTIPWTAEQRDPAR
jgi:hypothetical protein